MNQEMMGKAREAITALRARHQTDVFVPHIDALEAVIAEIAPAFEIVNEAAPASISPSVEPQPAETQTPEVTPSGEGQPAADAQPTGETRSTRRGRGAAGEA